MISVYICCTGSCEQFGEVYTAGAIREPSPTPGAAATHPDDPGPAASEEAVGETVRPAPAGAPVHAGPSQTAGCQNGNPFSSI